MAKALDDGIVAISFAVANAVADAVADAVVDVVANAIVKNIGDAIAMSNVIVNFASVDLQNRKNRKMLVQVFFLCFVFFHLI